MNATNRTPLDAAWLTERLSPTWHPRFVAETGSTNADLLAEAAAGAPDRSVLAAELQVTGRGRLDRQWTSPSGAGLTVSILLRPTVPSSTWGWLPLLTGLALARTVGEDARLKWPNDLLVGPEEKKAAGILAQSDGSAVVLGMGLNVSTTADELPVPTATSLSLQGHSQLNRNELLIGLLAVLDGLLTDWQAAGGDAEVSGLAGGYRQACSTLGRTVSVQLADRVLTGVAGDIDATGRLVVAEAGGDTVAVAAGDVTHVRPGR